MSITPEQIDIWRKAPSEHQRLEFKEAKTQLDNRKLYKHCVALANEGGGHLILGIADKLPRPVVGVSLFKANPMRPKCSSITYCFSMSYLFKRLPLQPRKPRRGWVK